MISYRHADIFDSLRKRQIEDAKPKIGQTVHVEAANPYEAWGGDFYGKIKDITSARILVSDDKDNAFWVNNGRFKVVKDENITPSGQDLVGKSVVVHDPIDDDEWNHSFSGSINDYLETSNMYMIEDQDSDFHTMTRDKFDVVD